MAYEVQVIGNLLLQHPDVMLGGFSGFGNRRLRCYHYVVLLCARLMPGLASPDLFCHFSIGLAMVQLAVATLLLVFAAFNGGMASMTTAVAIEVAVFLALQVGSRA